MGIGVSRSPGRKGHAAGVAVFALLALAPVLSAGPWVRVVSPHFALFTDAGQRQGTRTLERLEQINAAFSGLGPEKRSLPLPVEVFLFRSPGEFRHYLPSRITKGFYQSGVDADFIVLQAGNPEAGRVAFHEYVHLVLSHTSVRLPQWLEEGTAEFYSTLRAKADQLVIGDEIPNHARTLRKERWMEADEFESVTHESPVYSENRRAGIFYAQSWALVHMMNMAPDYRKNLPKFGRLLRGMPAAKAFQQAFGKSVAEALGDLHSYIRQPYRTITVQWHPPAEVETRVTPLSETEAARVKLALQLQMGLWDVSEKNLEKLARKQGETPEIETARAMVAMSRHQEDDAKRHFERAVAGGSQAARTYFEYAMLLRDTGAAERRVRELLQHAIALNPALAEGHFLLGVMASNGGDYEEAIARLEMAVRVLPRQSYFWHALALAYWASGRTAQARQASRKALEAARTGQETGMARAAVELTSREPEPRTSRKQPPVSTPSAWFNRQGNSRVKGTLERIECLGEQAVIEIRGGGKLVRLLVADPAKVVLENSGSVSFEFACGQSRIQSVEAEYVRRDDPETATAGELTRLRFDGGGR